MTTLNNRPRLTSRLLRAIGDKIAPRGVGEGRLCILNYHRILEQPDPLVEGDPDINTFRAQMTMLAECFNVLPLAEAVSLLTTERMPPRAVCVTFDDGYRSIHELALPVLKELKLPATVFVTSGYVGESNMWNDRIIEAIRRMPSGQLDLRALGMEVHPLNTLLDRKYAIRRLTHSAKYLPAQERHEFILRLEALAGNVAAPGLMLTRDMVTSLVRHGIEIGGHTITHPILARIDDATALKEIAGSKQQLEEMIGSQVQHFAYPNGKAGIDFDERHIQMAKDAGFTAAFTSSVAAATRQHDRYQIPRSLPWDRNALLFGVRILHWLMGERKK